MDIIHSEYLSDQGDETQRNFRYQHAYGAILCIAGASGKKPYSHIWCEHHEDLLAERSDDTFDAYQVKTRKPELGYWVINDDPVRKSFKRFAELNRKFKHKIRRFYFISNTHCFDCGLGVKDSTLKTSVVKLLEKIRSVDDISSISHPFDTVYSELSTFCNCSKEELFDTLKRTFIKVGPPKESFDTEISASHLLQMADCKSMSMTSLNSIRDEIIHAIYDASSLKIDDPYKTLYDPDEAIISPQIYAKRVSVDIVNIRIESFKEIIFRYLPHNLTLKVENDSLKSYDILTQKLVKGSLSEQVSTMKRRTLSAESQLFELSVLRPDEFSSIVTQLESVVQGECDDAALEEQILGQVKNEFSYGPRLLNNVNKRLKQIAADRPKLIFNLPFETLMGVAGLLTEECSVWWSKKFKLKDSA